MAAALQSGGVAAALQIVYVRRVDEGTPRNLNERTGRHSCIRCLAEVAAGVYFQNDMLCDACAEDDEYPLASTPDAKKKDEG